jgi:arsenical pump membrane protein
MSLLDALALDHAPAHAFAALIGGDLGPRLTPIGSLASLLWFDLLRKHDVTVRVTTFVRAGVALTVPTLAVSLALLWALAHYFA